MPSRPVYRLLLVWAALCTAQVEQFYPLSTCPSERGHLSDRRVLLQLQFLVSDGHLPNPMIDMCGHSGTPIGLVGCWVTFGTLYHPFVGL